MPMIAFASTKRVEKPADEKSIARQERRIRKRNVQNEKWASKEKNMRSVWVGEKIAVGKRKKVVIEHRVILKRRKKYEKVLSERRLKVAEGKRKTERAASLVAFVQKLIRRKEQQIRIWPTERKRQSIERAMNISIAFIFWTLLAKHKNVLTNEYKSIKKKSDVLATAEQSPWILFAIIWHLAMIRESGMRTVQTKTKQKKVKGSTYSPFLAPRGVIFAFVS
jgi:hypothetical protein